MLYHGFQIAFSSNRALFLPILLPDSIKNVKSSKVQDIKIEDTDYTFKNFCENCFKIPIDNIIECLEIDSRKYPNITFNDVSHLQVLYNHHPIGTYLYENFSFRAAHI